MKFCFVVNDEALGISYIREIVERSFTLCHSTQTTLRTQVLRRNVLEPL